MKQEAADPYWHELWMPSLLEHCRPAKSVRKYLSETFGISRAMARSMMERLAAQHFWSRYPLDHSSSTADIARNKAKLYAATHAVAGNYCRRV